MTRERFGHDERRGDIVCWLLTAVVAVDGLEGVLRDVPLWGGFELLVVAVAAIPAVATRDWTATVPWPLMAIAAVAAVARAAGASFEPVAYLAIATLALLVVAELEAYTSVELSRRFAIVFAVLTTLALQALWTIAQFYADQWLGTAYLRSQAELQWDFVVVTGVGLVLGALLQMYFARFEPAGGVSRNGTGSP
ncbi:hypothetical protein HTG_05700 [Natrinema mahii]|nr:hypothetical protein HTG_05700 [Natrinema mahii]